MADPTLPIALTIAGSDSGGGAGIQADLKTFEAFGVFGTSVVTAVTAQNTRGVTAVHAVPGGVVRAQIDAVALDLRPAAVKLGMLASAALIETVAEGLDAHALGPVILDPVMVATSGDRLLDRDAESTLATLLLPRARLVTPNLDEASILAGFPVTTPDEMEAAARTIAERGATAVLLKGGHLDADTLVDLLWEAGRVRRWERPRMRTRSTHGTGCTLSSAIAAGLARGTSLEDAVSRAIAYVQRAIAAAPGLGAGHGPLRHTVPTE
ncbi:MAG: bifunctional hydroxymethylpyrimidine kinase/phosphomethylpyrimidine kinase [Longimicrobiales bacterium]|nr:bifunctional hydroxymethylpyrimidine kinase/phosphomethylpyrimidine kinase [Longimicrobiales bacterium]